MVSLSAARFYRGRASTEDVNMSEALSESRQSHEESWASNLSEESDFWARWLTEDAFATDRNLRNDSRRPLPWDFIQHLDPEREVYNILDVGSGPASPIGALLQGKLVNLILTDPLADEYARMLDSLGMFNVIRPLKVRGEELTKVFPPGYFDIVSCNNALDHCADPLAVIREMVRVCRDSGWVHISSLVNVGELENYHGLHQWNLDVRDGRFIVWSQNSEADVLSCIPDIAEMTMEPVSGDPPQMALWLLVKKKI